VSRLRKTPASIRQGGPGLRTRTPKLRWKSRSHPGKVRIIVEKAPYREGAAKGTIIIRTNQSVKA
jgi:hypothetical protein